MYIPGHFQQTDRLALVEFIEAHGFALLVSHVAGELFATHLPLLVDREAGPHGCLLGHVARANPQWHELAGQDVMAIFSGPHAYVSPSWYESDNVVPTWNYVAVHAHGRCELVEDDESVAEILARSVAAFERSQAEPWTFDSADAYFRKLMKAVVAFRIPLAKLEGKWKLGQNHPPERREKVVRRLAASADHDSQAIARLMTQSLQAKVEPQSGRQ
jgi:transcriptional regulator